MSSYIVLSPCGLSWLPHALLVAGCLLGLLLSSAAIGLFNPSHV